jgi:hypothetical protein
MDAEYTVRRLVYDHAIKLQHGVTLVGYIDHEQRETRLWEFGSKRSSLSNRLEPLEPLKRLERRSRAQHYSSSEVR